MLETIALLVFFVGWLISKAKPWGDYVAIAGAALYVLLGILHLLHVA